MLVVVVVVVVVVGCQLGIYSRHILGTLFGLVLTYIKHGIGTTLNSVVDVVVVEVVVVVVVDVVVVGLSVSVLP